jgi:hypothetical protein
MAERTRESGPKVQSWKPSAVIIRLAIMQLTPPSKGPNIKPVIGAIIQLSLKKAPDTPMIGVIGMMEPKMFITANVEINAIFNVLVWNGLPEEFFIRLSSLKIHFSCRGILL